MPSAIFWALIGSGVTAAVGLLGIFIAQRTGYLQLSLMGKAHALNVIKATPRVGTTIVVEERYDNGKSFPPFLYLTTTIYNEGELPVSELKGYWKLSSTHGLANRTIEIQKDFLGSTPYHLQTYRIAESGASDAVLNRMKFDVDIQFSYLALPDNNSFEYSAKYAYDAGNRQMIKIL